MHNAIFVAYTSHADWTEASRADRITTFTLEDDARAAQLLELGRSTPLSCEAALYMDTQANALARLLCTLEDLQGRHFFPSDKILDISRN